ncbi:MAG TPA: response regulator transcription factor [Bacteroidia bacterium]|nr:Phosphate regulon transcriptional regulatory protein PhoB [Bacteroidia bacterium]MBX3106711.1 response regulator transcription factor [Bacteroidota bacterium]MCE7954067.1 DNA-binding response regulator [Bacteroidetes bacterium CHB6]OQB65288.1 MAG: Phosphate regulon transcriptional regulatory protein PhoB [Bacteroidetes bacterium ADurb.Bin141]MCB0849634.1 response regulator transcription factor [Bacteroidota bacterium]
MQQKILLVDDDKNISEILEFNLKSEGFQVDSVYSAEEALKKPIREYQLLLLDVMMGGMSGYKLAEQLRKEKISVPIIFLTAKDTENDMLTGFSVGGDDYISKPFSIKEVIARIKAVLKRTGNVSGEESTGNLITIGALTLDLNTKEVLLQSEKIALTKTEFELLALFAQKPDTLFSRERIIDIIWKETPYITERTVDVHIVRLRKKLGKYSDAITSRTGYGYRFNADVL